MSLNAPSGAGPSAHPRMQRNLRLLPWWWMLRWAWFGEGIWVIYLTDERGLTLGEALIFEAVFSAVVIATELPTGMIADRFGRRVSLLIGTTSVVFAFLAFGTSSSLWVLLSAYAFFAAAVDAGIRQIVILASELDSRAFRLPWPAGRNASVVSA